MVKCKLKKTGTGKKNCNETSLNISAIFIIFIFLKKMNPIWKAPAQAITSPLHIPVNKKKGIVRGGGWENWGCGGERIPYKFNKKSCPGYGN